MELGSAGCSSKICAFCTKSTAHSIPSWIGSSALQQFYSEFLTTLSSIENPQVLELKKKSVKSKYKNDHKTDVLLSPPENWTVCGQCLPLIQLVLESKENVNKVEFKVRKLQVKLLNMLHNLVVETDKMNNNLKKIKELIIKKPAEKGGFEEIASVVMSGGRPPSRKQNEDNKLINNFRQKVNKVIREIQIFQRETQTKFVTDDDDEPMVKLCTDNNNDNGCESDTEESVKESDCDSLAEQVCLKEETYSISSNDSLEKFNSQSGSSSIILEHCSKFREKIIKRINQAGTISTSKNIPKSSLNDPRRNYSIEYSGTGKEARFFVEDTEIIIVDDKEENEGLQCGSCDFKVDRIASQNKRWHIEDKIFEHILSNHLNLYTCSICGQRNETVFTWRAHKLTHLEEEKKRKWKCEICGKGFTSQSSVKTHKWTHLNEEEKKDKGNRRMMPSHFKGVLVKGMRFQCDKCGKEFNTAFNLRKHEKTHLGKEEREDEQVICGECGIKIHKWNLKRHRKRRHGGGVDKNKEVKRKAVRKSKAKK